MYLMYGIKYRFEICKMFNIVQYFGAEKGNMCSIFQTDPRTITANGKDFRQNRQVGVHGSADKRRYGQIGKATDRG